MHAPSCSRYVLSSHALQRMEQRGVSMEEVLCVLGDPSDIEAADGSGLIHFQAQAAGRVIRVTVNALSNVIVTVVTPGSTRAKSPYGWFTLGADLEAKR